ncbi:MAG: DUF3597 family protein, partial [Chthoniobacterales bacterium]
MGLFNTLMSKIFSHASAVDSPASTASAPAGQPASQPAPAAAPASAAASPTAAPPASSVDVAATLDALAQKNSEKLDWK